jgi:hypothetical protein
MLYCIYRYIIPEAVTRVVDIAVFRVSIYRIDSHIDSTVRGGIM